VIDVAVIGERPPPRLLKTKRPGAGASLLGILRSRHQIWALTMRDFRARYKQTFLGFGWALLLPLLTIAVFGIFVQRFAHANTHGAPYALWSLLGLISWNFFANSLNIGGLSLLNNQSLVNKIYSARQIYPIAGVLLAGLDALVSLIALAVIFGVTRFAPEATSYWVPLIALVNVVFVTAAVLLVSILIVYVRDMRNIVPFALQLGLFATPVVYALDQVSSSYRLAYCFANPMAPVIESYRRVVLYGQSPPWTYLGAGAATSAVLLVLAIWIFARFERGIVDII
jgi:ABC-type polysaccharide/polyol phosphate export permease